MISVTLSSEQLARLAARAGVAPHAAHRGLAGAGVCPQTIASVERAVAALRYAPVRRLVDLVAADAMAAERRTG